MFAKEGEGYLKSLFCQGPKVFFLLYDTLN